MNCFLQNIYRLRKGWTAKMNHFQKVPPVNAKLNHSGSDQLIYKLSFTKKVNLSDPIIPHICVKTHAFVKWCQSMIAKYTNIFFSSFLYRCYNIITGCISKVAFLIIKTFKQSSHKTSDILSPTISGSNLVTDKMCECVTLSEKIWHKYCQETSWQI